MQRSVIKHLLLALTGLLALTAARAAKGTVPPKSRGINPDGALLDSYIELLKPQVTVSDKQSGRDGRTTLTVKLTESSVSKFTPAVSPQEDGITIDVLNTWDAFKNMAQAFRRADEVNKKSANNPRVFPRTSLATRAATVAPPAQPDRTFAASETPTPNWFVSFPPNLLMVPFGQPTAAIADVLDVSYDDKASAVNMQLDIVHSPTTFSQFTPDHTPHALDTAAAHYHFATRPGMTVDAPAVLKSLKDSSYNLEGLHVFLKSEPIAFAEACYDGKVTTASSGPVTVGSTITATLEITPTEGCGSRVPKSGSDPVAAVVQVTGPATLVGDNVSPDQPSPLRFLRRLLHVVQYVVSLMQNSTLSLTQNFTVSIDGTGPVTISPLGYFFDTSANTLIIFANGGGGGAPGLTLTAVAAPGPAKVVLLPAKAYRRCGDPISLSAIAYTSAGAPVPNTNISFALFGDCEPDADTTTALTNANGVATVKVNAHKPGAVAIVAAAAVGANGAVAISAPSHVIYFNNRDHIERREREYFGRDRDDDRDHDDDRWRYDEDESDERRGDHDAWRYGQEAAKLAQQRALGAPVSSSA